MNYQEALAADLKIRLQRVQNAIQANGNDACVLATGVNIFYITGRVYNGYCFIPAEGKPIHFVKRPQDIDFENTIFIRKPEQIIEELEKRNIALPQNVLLESDILPYSEYMRIANTLQAPKFGNASVFMRQIRSVKTEFELTQIRKCARSHEAVYKQIPSVFRRGMTDIELQIEIERLMRLHGSLGIFRSYGMNMDIYMGSLLTGENAEAPSPFDYALGGQGANPILPLGASGNKIEEGQAIMVDMAGNYTPWMTDMTRVFSVGKTSELAYKAHEVSRDIHTKLESIIKPGITCGELYNTAMDIVKRNDLEAYFMGTKLQAKFIGHGVGLEINEPPVLTPRSKEILEPNIVFALEPKFVIPEIGAVGNENTLLVTETGVEKITIFEENIIEL